MGIIHSLKRSFVWLKRFRYRCGYGVHSPFAFNFITQVIYEKENYYAYKELEQNAEQLSTHLSRKLNRLFFRITNSLQPTTILEIGDTPLSQKYLLAAKRMCNYTHLTTTDTSIDVYLADLILFHYKKEKAKETKELIFKLIDNNITDSSVLIIEGIQYSPEMKQLWKQLKESERTGITFDLYDIGIIFFDRKKEKQHYKVNF
ncbi:hypothetical protein D0T50_09095 [Bacteroides sp. 214]|uniref:hypothetical protein n=1 Tax=Bacteroides sp. 214 TaxID=2302935 RepID=UPI0013D56145|nr:hypothetical protein [Bacteroides sp. 214]NDW13048.1 hypothetical protein [Bacteroides sp. 214]